ncbi:FAD-binding domain-containing protein [Xylariaceae sp. AK1471]|nr:FAD-binding domain-containing protein [Xylariaceae sp. AK1471]
MMLRQQIFVIFATLFTLTQAYTSKCKHIPGDPNWPKPADWARLNKTVDGRLVATVPVATYCHGANYRQEQCQELMKTWPFADAHVHAPAEFLAPYFQNQSCDPFTARDQPCELGNYAQYSINVSTVGHIQAGIQFARENNVRLTIKNTGHDLLGKSTGRGALSLWTHHLNAIDFLDVYTGSANYTGPSVRLGAGVLTSEVITAASNRGYRVVTGTCPDVGVAGGYTAGGGHGVFTSVYGMAADNVLEWEIVTAAGEHIVATPTKHADLYWALSGGGAGTFAVVVSMVTRVYPDGPLGGASLSFDVDSAGGTDEFWDGVAVFQSALGPLVDGGAVISYALLPTALQVYGIAIEGGNESVIDQALKPVTTALAQLGIPLNVTKTIHSGFLSFFNQYFLQAVTTTPQAQITGGRLVPRSLIESGSKAMTITEAFRNATDAGFAAVCDAVNAYKARLYSNAVLPTWRSTLLHCIFVKTWDFTIPRAEMEAYQTNLTEIVMPQIEAATPGGGAYLNEANFAQPDWQSAFYGSNYARLRDIKDNVDPLGVFYAQTAVGSEAWAEDGDGRLCQI